MERVKREEIKIMTFSETVEVLQQLKNQTIILEPRHFQLLKNKKVCRTFLKDLILYLVYLDSEISSYNLENDDKEDISTYSSIKESMKNFSIMFNLLFDNMKHVDLEYFFILYEKYVISQQTKHIHFLLFGVPDVQKVLVFILLNNKKCAIPLFASFYSRHKSRNTKALDKFLLRMKDDPIYINSLLYILCFIKNDKAYEVLMSAIKNRKSLFLNKKVVGTFNKIYNTK
ncbi:hypothetical protein DMUE_5211, partial [Dictyocoela muelleri]